MITLRRGYQTCLMSVQSLYVLCIKSQTYQVLGILGHIRCSVQGDALEMLVDTAPASSVVLPYRQLFDELGSISQSYRGFPKLMGTCWVNHTYLGQEILVLPLHSGGTEVAASPIAKGTDWLNIKHSQAPLALYPDVDGYVDSSEVVRSCNTYLSTLADYVSSDIQLPLIQLQLKNTEQPLLLLLTIPVDNKQQERIYYLVADGQGNWQRVSPDQLEAPM